MGEPEYLFADAVANFEESEVVLLGVPFDGTSSHRSGSAQAPRAIRQESYNFETFLYKYNLNLEDVRIHDMGDTKNFSNISELVRELPSVIQDVIRLGKFLLTLGGEHSITIPVIETLSEFNKEKDQEIGVVYLDAHLDFRDSYLDEKYSHASVACRLAELVGMDKIVSVGIRSYSAEEAKVLEDTKLRIYDADSINDLGIEKIIREAQEYLGIKSIYLSLDMDVLDPAYAPGVGNPEYFGLTPWQIRKAIEILGPNLIGADIVEVSPPYDNGNTAALAAQFIQIIISQISRH